MAAIIPPFRFTTVENRLYRGAYPTLPNFRFLRRLKLKTLISVIPEKPTKDLVDFCMHEGIAHHTFQAEKYSSDSVTVPPATVAAILHVLLNNDNLPIYIHCLDGANVIGIVVMALRKLQNWTKLATLQEFCRFTRDHSVEKDESEYLSTFSAEITLPHHVPRWLWNGVRIQKHPTMLVNNPTSSQASQVPPVEGDVGAQVVPSLTTPMGAQDRNFEGPTSMTYAPDADKTDPVRPFDDRREDRGEPVIFQEDLDFLYHNDEGSDVSIPRHLSALDLAGV
ncbi:hypothetical protein H310_07962 [Aphanomyces invadans]|uniref:Tyrosine specific protein phosphatases domain-containing protein n=1 Tax=Aphanomyces invadans TaxID=157072 RepID=A0A024U2Y6_9STRA|nr:hypothetical protein H310_07962 [Aphanomyces invadans]ETV99942.1 hypothetical protein H310_07962 [Aphanomyces invadans]|eukprot:XP_008871718.1 hypothetical protein H310_07962 [Aphanomyces invadans]